MSAVGAISLEHDTPELAASYEQAGIRQFDHGKLLVGPLAIKSGDRVLDIGAGTGRLTEFVAELVRPRGHVIGIDPLEYRIAIARLRQTRHLKFEIGRAEDLARFADAEFDVVYLNSVFHWIADKRQALREIRRVLKPGGRVGLNVQDPAKPHESRALLKQAFKEAGLNGWSSGSHPALGAGEDELAALFEEAGFEGYRSELRTIVDIHNDVDSVLRWSEASAFGNFLDGVSEAERKQLRAQFASLLESRRAPEGLRLERYLRFAFARKPDVDPLQS